MKITILGNGYISNHLRVELEKKNHVDVVSKSILDYGKYEQISQYLKDKKPDVLICAFGFTGSPNIDEAESKKELCWKLNTTEPTIVNAACCENNVGFACVSSGCIYNGYDKCWTSEDEPNFGLFHESSFYSKSKHAFEISTRHLSGTIFRIRLPFSGCNSKRNYLQKLLGYHDLIDAVNSKTSVRNLVSVVNMSLDMTISMKNKNRMIMQIVNKNPLKTSQITEIMKKNDLYRHDWNFISIDDLKTAAPRSNCLLQIEANVFSDLIKDEAEEIDLAIKQMKI